MASFSLAASTRAALQSLIANRPSRTYKNKKRRWFSSNCSSKYSRLAVFSYSSCIFDYCSRFHFFTARSGFHDKILPLLLGVSGLKRSLLLNTWGSAFFIWFFSSVCMWDLPFTQAYECGDKWSGGVSDLLYCSDMSVHPSLLSVVLGYTTSPDRQVRLVNSPQVFVCAISLVREYAAFGREAKNQSILKFS